MPNRLADETSPYLLQHADNPVDWYPWGEEAFAKARAEDKPILLSVGYSACHWCHVMAHESFEDEGTAALMNDWFVNIKVDREERPDVDGIYMLAVQALTGRGGWPMTVFMTADRQPFYAGTYYPPKDGHGLPSFGRVMEALHRAWVEERPKILASAEGITEHLQASSLRGRVEDGFGLTPDMAETAVAHFAQVFDSEWGGFGSAPKFPSPANLEFLLAHHARTGDPDALGMVTSTLRAMATGGMYDQLGGGFSRYSVDGRWLIPHFEKMLYDNAQLVRVYLHAWQITGEPLFERIVRETLSYLVREMRDAEGGFYAAQDADSEGIEGKFFVWTQAELEAALGEDWPLFAACHDIGEEGNFHDPHHPDLVGRSVVSRRYDPVPTAAALEVPVEELERRLEAARRILYRVRSGRIRPGLDDKVLTSWNGLVLAAFAEAARVLNDAVYREVAEGTASFLREKLWVDGRLLHTYKRGIAKIDGMVEDYTFTGLGFVEIYRLTGDFAYLEFARDLWEVLVREFHDPEHGGFFETTASGEKLLVRQKSLFDEATPSGNGSGAQLTWWLSRYFEREDWAEIASECLSLSHQFMTQAPNGFGSLWQTAELLLAPRQELVITGEPAAREPLERAAAAKFLPWLVLAPGSEAGIPLFEGRTGGSEALAYFCENMACQLPVSEPDALAAQLASAAAR